MYGGRRENWCNHDIHASENESGYVHACVYVEDDYLPKCQQLGQLLQQKFRRILFLTLASILKPVKMRHSQFLAQSNANAFRRLMIIPNVDSVLPNENASKREESSAVVVNVTVTSVNFALELFDVFVPQLSSLSIQGRVAIETH